MSMALETGETGLTTKGYVAAVRYELRDLPAETQEELTGGLEADLTEALDRSRSPVEMFGPAKAYAAELRSAAGLASRSWRPSLPGWSFGAALVRALDVIRDDARAQFAQALGGRAWWPPARDFLRALHPSWWGFRAFLTYWFLSQLGAESSREPIGKDLGLPHSPATWLAMAALLILSVELGRRRLPAVVGLVVVALECWLIVGVLLVLPVSLYWAW